MRPFASTHASCRVAGLRLELARVHQT